MDELKLCPFCGGKPKLHKDTWPTPTGKAVAYWIRCANCGSCSDEFKTAEKATAAWNKRHDHV